MQVLFVPRQEEDLGCKYLNMYYNKESEKVDLCSIELALINNEIVTIKLAPPAVINSLKTALIPGIDPFNTSA
jgi:hypothetical protein